MEARVRAAYALLAAGVAFMGAGVLLAYRGGVLSGLLAAASGATLVLVGGDLLRS